MPNAKPTAAPEIFTWFALDIASATRIVARCLATRRWFEVTPRAARTFEIKLEHTSDVRELVGPARR